MAAKMKVLHKKGKKPIKFHPGGLHDSLGVPMGKPIPAGLMEKAMSGEMGAKAERQAQFKKNILTGRKKRRSGK